MGMYDTLIVACIECGNCIELQSKAGDCYLIDYTIKDVPLGILADIAENQNPIACDSCGTAFVIRISYTVLMEREE